MFLASSMLNLHMPWLWTKVMSLLVSAGDAKGDLEHLDKC